MTIPSLRTLEQIEDAIDVARLTINEALMEILDRQLYKQTHASFDLYCEERWQITGRTARRRVEALRSTLALGPGAESVSQQDVMAGPEAAQVDAESRTSVSDSQTRGGRLPVRSATEREQIAPNPEAMPPAEYRPPATSRIPSDQDVEDALFALLDEIDPPVFYARLTPARRAHLRAWVHALNPPTEAPRTPKKAGESRPAPAGAPRAPAPLDRRDVVTLFKKGTG